MKCFFYGVVGAFPNLNLKRNYTNTSCVYLETDSAHLIFDAGSGLLDCSKSHNLSTKPIFIFLSHFHYDHIMGLLFFPPLLNGTNDIYFIHPNPKLAEKTIKSFFSPIFFPLTFSSFHKQPSFISPHDCKKHSLSVDFCELSHPGKAYAYKLSFLDKQFIYATDNELSNSNHTKYVSFFKSASILIHDCFFYNENKSHVYKWGHSFLHQNLQLAHDANVKNLCLFHHNPNRTDSQFLNMKKDIDIFIKKNNSVFNCYITYDSFSLDF
jgi:ribonuclease BN (tRNA processing enzyme)